MKKNEEPFQMKGKGMAAAIAICFIAVVALVGAYTFLQNQSGCRGI